MIDGCVNNHTGALRIIHPSEHGSAHECITRGASKESSITWGLRGFTVRDLDGNLIGIVHEVGSPLGRPEYRELSVDG